MHTCYALFTNAKDNSDIRGPPSTWPQTKWRTLCKPRSTDYTITATDPILFNIIFEEQPRYRQMFQWIFKFTSNQNLQKLATAKPVTVSKLPLWKHCENNCRNCMMNTGRNAPRKSKATGWIERFQLSLIRIVWGGCYNRYQQKAHIILWPLCQRVCVRVDWAVTPRTIRCENTIRNWLHWAECYCILRYSLSMEV